MELRLSHCGYCIPIMEFNLFHCMLFHSHNGIQRFSIIITVFLSWNLRLSHCGYCIPIVEFKVSYPIPIMEFKYFPL